MLSASSDPLISTKRFVRSPNELEEPYTKEMAYLICLVQGCAVPMPRSTFVFALHLAYG